MKIATIINYCTNDYRFIKTCIDQVRPFSSQIIVPVSSHFFNGIPENSSLIEKTVVENQHVDFISYEWQHGKPSRYYHNMSRLVGTKFINNDIDWVLFIDADEILDSQLTYNIISSDIINKLDSFDLASYWYFREPIYQAKVLEQQGFFIKKDLIKIDCNSHFEREQFIVGKNKRGLTYNGTPILHHYSWVRTKDEMLTKVKTWGHNTDKDWVSLVEKEFAHPFNGTDFIHGYEYNTVENRFNL